MKRLYIGAGLLAVMLALGIFLTAAFRVIHEPLQDALLRAQARQVGICDIRQKAGCVYFTLSNLNFEAVSALCADKEYKTRVQFQASSKQPVLQLKLASGVDSLKQSKVFITHYRRCCGVQ